MKQRQKATDHAAFVSRLNKETEMKVIIDRFEGEYAVCEKEDRKMMNIEKNKLPSIAKEGDVLIIEGNDIKIGLKETFVKEKKIRKMMDNLWE